MKILLINQYYYPDIAATAQLCADLCEDLAAMGHEVTVVAGTAWYRTPHAGSAPLQRRALPLHEAHRGVRIRRVPVPGADRGGLAGQALGYGVFLGGALCRVVTQERPDVVVALSTPPLVAALGLLVQRLRGARFVYWVQDVYPDLAVQLGVMRRGGAAARAFSALSRLLYQRADAVVTLDRAMAERVRAAGAGRVHVIDNWSDAAEVTPQAAADNALRREAGLGPGRFTVGYAGNLGRGHDFDTVAAAMVALRDQDVSWLFIGDGPQRAALERRAQGLAQVRFLPPQARERLRDALTAGDVGLVTLQSGLEGLLVPSKLYGMLAAGRPVVYVGPPAGRVSELVAGEGLGAAVRNGDVAGLCAAVLLLRDDAAGRARMGARARQVLEQLYGRRLATALHEAVLLQVVGPAGGAGCPAESREAGAAAQPHLKAEHGRRA